jgi:hypothetical protein
MSYRGIPNWPPTWVWVDGPEEKHPQGELGILRSVLSSRIQHANRFFLLMAYEGSSYLGCLLFDDEVFCHQLMNELRAYCNWSIAEIGSLDLTHTL